MSAACRRMTLADVPQVHAIEERTFAPPWSYQRFVDEMTTNKCARYLVAEEDGRVIAYAGAWLIFEEGHITNIAVDEPYRGRGVGTEVTRALMQYAANMGVQYLTLEVRRSNLVAQKMYRSLGFLKLGLRKRYYETTARTPTSWSVRTCPRWTRILRRMRTEPCALRAGADRLKAGSVECFPAFFSSEMNPLTFCVVFISTPGNRGLRKITA